MCIHPIQRTFEAIDTGMWASDVVIALDFAMQGLELRDDLVQALERAVEVAESSAQPQIGLLALTRDRWAHLLVAQPHLAEIKDVYRRAAAGERIDEREFELAAKPFSELSDQMLAEANSMRGGCF
jgi:hypothetical protein